jgi:hypothetical protein
VQAETQSLARSLAMWMLKHACLCYLDVEDDVVQEQMIAGEKKLEWATMWANTARMDPPSEQDKGRTKVF